MGEIVKRLKEQGKRENLRKIIPPKDWSTARDGGPETGQGGFTVMKSGSRLERLIEKGEFVVTAELGPPMSASPEIIAEVSILSGTADAFNITDNQTAVVRMSSIATAKPCLDSGPNLSCKWSAGTETASQCKAIYPAPWRSASETACAFPATISRLEKRANSTVIPRKNAYDVDSITLINILKNMRDEHRLRAEIR